MARLGVPGVYTRRLSVTPSDIASHRRLLNYLKLYYWHHKKQLGFSPWTCSILDSVANLSFVPCFLLAWSLIRINEIKQLSVVGLKSRQPIRIKSSKSSHVRFLEPLDSFKLKLLLSVPDNTHLMVISYDSLKSQIKSARLLHKIVLEGNAHSCTHIFRHLEATWMHRQGVPIDCISKCLGHNLNKTTRQYFHVDL